MQEDKPLDGVMLRLVNGASTNQGPAADFYGVARQADETLRSCERMVRAALEGVEQVKDELSLKGANGALELREEVAGQMKGLRLGVQAATLEAREARSEALKAQAIRAEMDKLQEDLKAIDKFVCHEVSQAWVRQDVEVTKTEEQNASLKGLIDRLGEIEIAVAKGMESRVNLAITAYLAVFISLLGFIMAYMK